MSCLRLGRCAAEVCWSHHLAYQQRLEAHLSGQSRLRPTPMLCRHPDQPPDPDELAETFSELMMMGLLPFEDPDARAARAMPGLLAAWRYNQTHPDDEA